MISSRLVVWFMVLTLTFCATVEAQQGQSYRAGQAESSIGLTDESDSGKSTGPQESSWSDMFGWWATGRERPSRLASDNGIKRAEQGLKLRPGASLEDARSASNRFHAERNKLTQLNRMGRVYGAADKLNQLSDARGAFANGHTYHAGAIAANTVFADTFAAGAAELAVWAVGTTTSGGTLLVGAVAAVAANELYNRLGKPYLEERAAEQELGAVRMNVDEANAFLKQHRPDLADAAAAKALEGLRSLVAKDQSGFLARSEAARVLEREGLEVRGTVAQARQLSEQATSFLLSTLRDAQNNRFSNARPMVERYLQQRELLELAGESHLIQRLEGLEGELAEIADRLAARQKEIAENKEKPRRNKAEVTKPTPQPAIITAEGPWRAERGSANGTITVTIDVDRQTFSATFNGGPGGKSSTAYAGEFNGSFTGNEKAGTLRGGGDVNVIARGKHIGSESFQINAHLNGGTVSGKASGKDQSYRFNVPVQ
ncbi:MAG: hypothetical protein WEB58_18750 [Planctomycetaceae bacterium]